MKEVKAFFFQRGIAGDKGMGGRGGRGGLREGKLDVWSRWGIKQWGSCDTAGFPYFLPRQPPPPPRARERPYTEAGSDERGRL